jgi:hypothetical protein
VALRTGWPPSEIERLSGSRYAILVELLNRETAQAQARRRK